MPELPIEQPKKQPNEQPKELPMELAIEKPKERPAERPKEKREEIREENLPIDARLLSDAVIELNISRRSVGLYPPGHARIGGAIERAFQFLAKLFELRSSISLGITKDALVIDDKALDSRNPIFRECAESFHRLGIAGIKFQRGVEKSELVALHELMTMPSPPVGMAFVEAAEQKGIKRLKLDPLDYSSFKFVEGEFRAGGHKNLIEDYVYGLMHGKLATGDARGVLLKAPPQEVARYIEEASADGKLEPEAYDRVVASYMRESKEGRISPEALAKLVSLMNNLTPEMREQFLSRALDHITSDMQEVDVALRDMNSLDLETVTAFFNRSRPRLPNSLKNVIDKFTKLRADQGFAFDVTVGNATIVHDIELHKELAGLFEEDHFASFVSDAYRSQLDRMLTGSSAVKHLQQVKDLEEQCRQEVIDRVSADILLEVLDSKDITAGDYMKVVTGLSRMAGEFVDSGRFEEALNIYNTIYSQSFTGRYREAALGTVEYFFRSGAFLGRVITATRIWGRSNREQAMRLTRAFKAYLIVPLMDMLAVEKNPSARKYLLALLGELGSDIMPEVIARLKDKRPEVVRDMLMLTRKCGTPDHSEHVRKFCKHPDRRIWGEALRALVRLKPSHAVPFIKIHLQSENSDDREAALKIAGAYKLADVVPMLIDMLGRKDVLGTGAYYKVAVVRALGEIGGPEALPSLEQIISTRAFIFRGYLDELKLEIYRSLKGYPPKDVQRMAEAGLGSENAEIKAICKSIVLGGPVNG